MNDPIPDLMRRTTFATTILVAVTLLSPRASDAQETEDLHPLLGRGFNLDVGVFLPDREHKLSATGSVAGAIDTPDVDFFGEIGARSTDSLFSTELDWKFGERWGFRAQYFKSSSEERSVLQRDIEWDGETFLAGSSAAIGSEFQVTRFFFGRSMNSQRHHDFGLGAGVHWLNIRAFVEGTALQPGGATVVRREATSVEGPMPTFGIWYNRSLSRSWVLTSRFDYMYASIDKYDGRYVNAAVGVNYAVSPNLGAGVSYNYIELDVGITDNNWRGKADIDYRGFYLYLSWFWK